jgi:hypothetical protein
MPVNQRHTMLVISPYPCLKNSPAIIATRGIRMPSFKVARSTKNIFSRKVAKTQRKARLWFGFKPALKI